MEQVNKIVKNMIPAKSGIYFWYATGDAAIKIAKSIGAKIKTNIICIYVGKSVNLNKRFRYHTKTSYKAPRTSTFSWTLRSLLGDKTNGIIQNLFFDFEVTNDIAFAEKQAITKNKPLLNINDCVNKFETIITAKRKQFKQKHPDIWKK